MSDSKATSTSAAASGSAFDPALLAQAKAAAHKVVVPNPDDKRLGDVLQLWAGAQFAAAPAPATADVKAVPQVHLSYFLFGRFFLILFFFLNLI